MNNDYNEERIELPTLKGNIGDESTGKLDLPTLETNEIQNNKPIFNEGDQPLILNSEKQAVKEESITTPVIEYPILEEQSNLDVVSKNEVSIDNEPIMNNSTVDVSENFAANVSAVIEEPTVSQETPITETAEEQKTSSSQSIQNSVESMVPPIVKAPTNTESPASLETSKENVPTFSKKSQIIGTIVVLIIVGVIIYLMANSFFRL